MVNTSKIQENYFIQLDGIRFVAVSLVLVDHWLAERNVIPLGVLGVTMFFVLSGFLITRILIQSKLKDEKTGRSPWFSVRQFIVRRSIRIFPIYYLTIFLCVIFNVPPVREQLIWCITYATNIYIALNQRWMGVIDHLWSLAVEEQYYLFFPYVILFLPKRYFLKIFFGMIALAVLLRLFLHLNHSDWMVQYVLMPTSLDAFGLGALMAYFFTFHKESTFKTLSKTMYLLISFGLYVSVLFYEKFGFENPHNIAYTVIERFFAALFCFFFIINAVTGYKGLAKVFFENGVVQYLGKISYGLYLYHNFVYNYYHTPQTSITLRILRKIHQYLPALADSFAFQFFYFSALTIFVATLSWFLIEKPVNSLKRYFNY
ncbi:Peptidoglycan/LPS O-acetylase OafA/YrhL, contains acyltransferase and SGNH-hydrolase domains [Pseudarcicella hirudinis]|uniref:Peptidoglycan/LPS O-acetylase OafA/YrhL, contains acyltransferase and SGNH-hydrolase domains n=1 Tax=Pseudarcicella hirudinis TaxID=1079859 RepID=A0A1I5VGD5_9BACT|nr:acyltransferase [Pseudarcicella hirudinis]SFQ06594.1 Peptidoglycan/LPS O-acetylase OafA/YrhL, contains acyltransferase and SGNH-hydrolase domains [Pseudarcicella hirudinis]